MNIWDSVQRGLERASQEAARIAHAQRLRSTIDTLSRQISTQNDVLISRTMELFTTGQLTQIELVALCQEMTNLQQQLAKAQYELKQLQNQGQGQPVVPAPPPASGDVSPTVFAPPPPEYQFYSDSTVAVPPPPPGVEPLTISGQDTNILPESKCPSCQADLAPGTVYCYNCGQMTQGHDAGHLPTVRGGTSETAYPAGQGTNPAEQSEAQKTVYAPPEQENVPPPPPTQKGEAVSAPQPTQQDGGQ